MPAPCIAKDNFQILNSANKKCDGFCHLGYNPAGQLFDMVDHRVLLARSREAVYNAYLVAEQENSSFQVLLLQGTEELVKKRPARQQITCTAYLHELTHKDRGSVEEKSICF